MQRHRTGNLLGLLVFAAAYGLAFIIAYFLTDCIYRLTGQPPEIVRHLLTCLTAILVVFTGMHLLLRFAGQSHRDDLTQIHDQLTEALSQIAQGRFDVLIDPGSISFYGQLAEAINNMAHDLGTLDTMRAEFVSNVSHEIQSPLTSINGFATLLLRDDLDAATRKHYAAIIESESRRLSSLSDNLLKLSTLDNNKNPLVKRQFRLDRQLEQIALSTEPQWSAKQLAMVADLPATTLYGDDQLLMQCWSNLLNNAIKFTPDGGQITIKVTPLEHSVEVAISDTGIGIAPEHQLHVFERFYKADKARDRSLGGNGLGLSLAKTIVELHDGSINVRSQVGVGTTFMVQLPQDLDH